MGQGYKARWVDGCMGKGVDRNMDGWLDGAGDRWVDGYMDRQVANLPSGQGFILFYKVSCVINPVSISHTSLNHWIPSLLPRRKYLFFQIIGFSDRDEKFGIICSILLISQVRTLRPERGKDLVKLSSLQGTKLVSFCQVGTPSLSVTFGRIPLSPQNIPLLTGIGKEFHLPLTKSPAQNWVFRKVNQWILFTKE